MKQRIPSNCSSIHLFNRSLARTEWIAQRITQGFTHKRCSTLVIGCKEGHYSNALACYGHYVTGVDVSEECLEKARQEDVTHTVFYCQGNGYALPFVEQQFEIVCALDLLEYVEEPAQVIREASRVLKKGGYFFFHSLNRNRLKWFFSSIPKPPFFRLLITPKEMQSYLEKNDLIIKEIFGLSSPGRFTKQTNYQSAHIKWEYMGFAIKI